MQIEVPSSVFNWMSRGERGTSSDTIVESLWKLPLTGRWGKSHPHDPDDLRRCLLLLQASPETAERFEEMALESPEWQRLMERWKELEAMFREEIPNIHDCFGWSAPKTYAAMRATIERSPTTSRGDAT